MLVLFYQYSTTLYVQPKLPWNRTFPETSPTIYKETFHKLCNSNVLSVKMLLLITNITAEVIWKSAGKNVGI